MSRKNLNVLYQSSDAYSMPTAVSMASLCANNRDIETINFYLLNDNISEENLKKIDDICSSFERNLEIINTDSIREKLISLGLKPYHGSYATYYKLFAMNMLDLPDDYVLYLDGDTLVDGSLSELLNLELDDDCILAAALDLLISDYKEIIGISVDRPYYNAGVMFLNVKKWQFYDCENIILDHIVNSDRNYAVVDQDLLNVLFYEQIEQLNLKFNFYSVIKVYGAEKIIKMYGLTEKTFYKTSYVERTLEESPSIIHCFGGMTGRPWEIDNEHPYSDLFDKYLEYTPWSINDKTPMKRDVVFRLQHFAYKHFPEFIYEALRKTMHSRWYKKQDKLSNKN